MPTPSCLGSPYTGLSTRFIISCGCKSWDGLHQWPSTTMLQEQVLGIHTIFSYGQGKLKLVISNRVETERRKHRSSVFRALNFSIRSISSTILDFKFLIRDISCWKMIEHFEQGRVEPSPKWIPISGKYFHQFENLCLNFEQKYEKQIFFSYSQPFLLKLLCFNLKYQASISRIEFWSGRAWNIRSFFDRSNVFEHLRSRSWLSRWIFEQFEPNLERSYAWSQL